MFDREPDGRVTVETLLPNLRGVGILGKKKLEIPYSLPGDVYDVYKFGKRKFFYKWNPVDLKERSAIPSCPKFGECGGCSGQHLPYSEQFRLKSDPVLSELSLLSKTGGSAPASGSYGYRNRMDFVVFPNRIVGLRMAGNFRRIVDLESCSIQSDWANEEMRILPSVLKTFPELEYDRKKETGYLKYVTLRKSVFTEDSMTIFTFTEDFRNSPELSRFTEEIPKISTAKNIVLCFNRRKGEISASGEAFAAKGNLFLEEKIETRTFKIPFDGFFQPNPREFLTILDFIRKRLEPSETLVDLFCGSGFFSLLFGKDFPHILGIDIVPSSVSAGEETLAREFPDKKIEYSAFDLFHKKGILKMESASLPWKDSVLIADPPRSGLSPELCEFLNRNPVRQLFYVSCNPYNLIRDTKLLEESYVLEDFLLCDPFPQTPHMEAVAYFSPKKR